MRMSSTLSGLSKAWQTAALMVCNGLSLSFNFRQPDADGPVAQDGEWAYCGEVSPCDVEVGRLAKSAKPPRVSKSASRKGAPGR